MPLDEEEKVLLCSMRSKITRYSDWSSLSGQLERKLLTLGSMWHVRRGETRELVLVLSKTHVAELVRIKLDGCAACGQSFLLCGRRAGPFLQIQPRGCDMQNRRCLCSQESSQPRRVLTGRSRESIHCLLPLPTRHRNRWSACVRSPSLLPTSMTTIPSLRTVAISVSVS